MNFLVRAKGRILRDLSNAAELSRLQRSKYAEGRALAEAVRFARARRYSADESDLLSKIERIRHLLLSSPEVVDVFDYGAGDQVIKVEGGRAPARSQKKVSEICANYSKPAQASELLFQVIRKIGPATALELGTCLGLSASYQAGAMRLNGKGRLLTLEGSPPNAAIARRTITDAGLADYAQVVVGAFADTLNDALQSLQPLEYAFVDGHHDGAATIEYFERIKSLSAPGAVLVFDDIFWSPSMTEAWRVIEADPGVCVSITLTSMGVAVLGTGEREAYRLSI